MNHEIFCSSDPHFHIQLDSKLPRFSSFITMICSSHKEVFDSLLEDEFQLKDVEHIEINFCTE
jgi:hypothetical protein